MLFPSAVLLFSLFPAAVQAQFSYTINADLTLTITGYSGPGGAVTIPATINGLPVAIIGRAAFQSSTNLTSVTFPDSITNISDYAFNACPSLTNVTIGNGITTIGYQAFGYCSNLTNVSIPDSVVSLGDAAFSYSGLVSVTTGNGITNIGGAFQYCLSLVSITLGSRIANIPNNAFAYCPLFTINVDTNNPYYSSIDGVLFNRNQSTLFKCPINRTGNYTVPGTVTSIGYGAFDYCENLTSVTILNSVTNIGDWAFHHCSSLVTFTIPNSVTYIGNYTFAACYNVVSVSIGNSVGSIGDLAFSACTSLTNITIPDSVTNLGQDAFAQCYSLANLTLSKNLTTIGSAAFAGCSSLTRVSIPNGNIAPFEFQGCGSLTNVTIGPMVTYFNASAFDGCPLTAIYCLGNAPTASGVIGAAQSIVYYLPGTTGWGPTFAGRPALPINMEIQVGDANFGIRTNQFGFNIAGSYGLTFVVEAATNLTNPTWYSLQTNTLSGGAIYFSDPQWTNYPRRFYRLRFP